MSKGESVQAYFDRTARAFSDRYLTSADFLERRRVWQNAIEKALPRLADGSCCLDVGCGDGTLGQLIWAKGFKTIGIDQSETMLAIARQRATERGVAGQAEYEYIAGSLPLSGDLERRYANTAGVILCSSVLEYIPEYEQVLAQCHRLLKPGGVLLLSLPNQRSWYRACERTLRPIFVCHDSYVKYQRHQFSLSQTKGVLEKTGYRILDEQFYALPFQRYSTKVFGHYRAQWLATMFLIVAEKPDPEASCPKTATAITP